MPRLCRLCVITNFPLHECKHHTRIGVKTIVPFEMFLYTYSFSTTGATKRALHWSIVLRLAMVRLAATQFALDLQHPSPPQVVGGERHQL